MALKFGIFDHLERLRDIPIDQQYRDRLNWWPKLTMPVSTATT